MAFRAWWARVRGLIDLVVHGLQRSGDRTVSGHFDDLAATSGAPEQPAGACPIPSAPSRGCCPVVVPHGRYAIVDRAATRLGERSFPRQRASSAGHPCDELQIGGYTIRVQRRQVLRGRRGRPLRRFRRARLRTGGARPAAPPAYVDPLAASRRDRPPPRGATMPPPPAAASGSASGIPADWDPFAPDAPAPASGRSVRWAASRCPERASFGSTERARRAPHPDFAPVRKRRRLARRSFASAAPAAGRSPGGSALPSRPHPTWRPITTRSSLNSVTRASTSSASDTTSELSHAVQIPAMSPSARPRRPAPPGTVGRFVPPCAARCAAILSLADPRSAAAPRSVHPRQPAAVPADSFRRPLRHAFGGLAAPARSSGGSAASSSGARGSARGRSAARRPPPMSEAGQPAAPARAGEAVAPPGSVLSWAHPRAKAGPSSARAVRSAAAACRCAESDALDLSLDFDSPTGSVAPAAIRFRRLRGPAGPGADAAPFAPSAGPTYAGFAAAAACAAPFDCTCGRCAPAAGSGPPRPPSAFGIGRTPAWRPPPGSRLRPARLAGADVQR